nr:hypothetical protein KPHV_30000 [Kitasatospora purpeofusca]
MMGVQAMAGRSLSIQLSGLVVPGAPSSGNWFPQVPSGFLRPHGGLLVAINSADVLRVLAEMHQAGVESEASGGNSLAGGRALAVLAVLGGSPLSGGSATGYSIMAGVDEFPDGQNASGESPDR